MERLLDPSDLTPPMKIRSALRRALPALVAALAAPAALLAQPITYTFSGTTSFFGGPQQSYVITLKANASHVADRSSIFPAPSGTYLLSTASNATVSLDGGAAQSLSSLMSGYTFGVGALNGAPLVGSTPTTGVGFVGQNLASGDYFGLFLPTGISYGLASNFGPVTGDSYYIEGSFNVPNAAQFVTLDYTPVQVESARWFGQSTFTAEITATPEPASVALMATGLVVIGGAAVRRRRTQG
jgi:hypothetical protein